MQLNPVSNNQKTIGICHLDSGIDCRGKDRKMFLRKAMVVDRLGNLSEKEKLIDKEGHGTHTAGIIYNIFSQSKTEVHPQGNLYSICAMNGGRHLLRILTGMNWLLDQPIRVACMAIGVKSWTPVFRPMLRAMRSKGILPIISIGNGGAGKAFSPGWDPLVLSVGAADNEGFAARFSGSYNPLQNQRCLAPSVLAPGVDIRSWSHKGGYHIASGTSMAAAHVTGLAARIFQRNLKATVEEVEAAICFSTSPPPKRSSHKVVFGNVTDAAEQYLKNITSEHLDELHLRKKELEDSLPKEKYFDPRLQRQLRYTGEGMKAEAIIGWQGAVHSPPPTLSLDCEVLQHFSIANQIAIRTWPEEIRVLAENPQVNMLSAVDIDYPNI